MQLRNLFLATLFLISGDSVLGQTKSDLQSFLTTYVEAFPQNQGENNEQNLISFDGSQVTYSNVLTKFGVIFTYRFDLSKVNNIVMDELTMGGKNIEYKIFFVPGYSCDKIIYTAVDDKTEYSKYSYASIIVSGNSRSDGVNLKIREWFRKISISNGAKLL